MVLFPLIIVATNELNEPSKILAITKEALGSIENGTLEIVKFLDYNGNAIRDPGEVGISNIEFVIEDLSKHSENKTILSGKKGVIQLELMPGFYSVRENINVGWKNTTSLEQFVTISSNITSRLYFGNNHVSYTRTSE